MDSSACLRASGNNVQLDLACSKLEFVLRLRQRFHQVSDCDYQTAAVMETIAAVDQRCPLGRFTLGSETSKSFAALYIDQRPRRSTSSVRSVGEAGWRCWMPNEGIAGSSPRCPTTESKSRYGPSKWGCKRSSITLLALGPAVPPDSYTCFWPTRSGSSSTEKPCPLPRVWQQQ